MRVRAVIVIALAALAVAVGLIGIERFTESAERAATATVETEPVPNDGDAADDPAIWIDRKRPRRSTVIGTDKRGGIAVYDLAGREVQYRPDGEINNVDVRGRFPLGSGTVSIAAATNGSSNTVAIYRVDPRTRALVSVEPEAARPDLAVSGICLYERRTDRSFGFFVTGDEGEVEQWRLSGMDGSVIADRVRRFKLKSETEACVVDDESETAYFAEETRGIWRWPLDPRSQDRPELVASAGEDNLAADVEGLAIVRFPDAPAQLVASSQGSDSYVVYRIDPAAEYLYDFEIVDGEKTDGAVITDGIDATTQPLGRAFPHGLLVVQDGANDDGNQNFKLVALCARAVACE